MPRKSMGFGPIGKGWVEERTTATGVRFFAVWQRYEPDSSRPAGRKKTFGGQYDLGPLGKRGEGFRSKAAAVAHWQEIWRDIVHPAPEDKAVQGASALSQAKDPAHTFKEYCAKAWIPANQKRWRSEATREAVSYYLDTKLYPRFGEKPLTRLTQDDLQSFLDQLAAQYSETVVDHSMIYLQSILKHAHGSGAITTNPSQDLEKPECREPSRPALLLAEAGAVIEELPTRKDKLIGNLLYFGGVRKGELFAVRWNDFSGLRMKIDSQIAHRSGKEAQLKTRASRGDALLPEELVSELDAWRRHCADWGEGLSDSDYVFQSRKRTPINSKNWLNRVLKPAAKRAGLDNITYHMFRRGLATVMHDHGASDKSIQGQLRHSSPDVAREVYMRTIDKSRQAAIEEVYQQMKVTTSDVCSL